MIKIEKNGTEFTYNSIAHATRENGATSGMNRKTALKYLEKCGFDIDTLQEDTSTRTRTTRSSSIIERLIKQCQTVDKDLIKKLTDELNHKVANLTTASSVDDIVKLNEQIEKAKNPEVTLENILELVTNMYTEYMEQQEDEDDGKATENN